MKKFTFLLILACNFQFAPAQNTETDSLKKLLIITKEDTTRVLVLEGLSYAFHFSYPDTALQYALEGLRLAQEINYPAGEAYCINALGNIYFNTGNYPRALEMYLQALKIRERLNDQRTIAVSNSNIGNIYSEQGDNAQALTYMLKTKRADEKLKDSAGLLIDQLNIGTVYFRMNKLDSALWYEKQAYSIAIQLHDQNFIGAVMITMGDIYDSLHNTRLAMENYRLGLENSIAINDHEEIPNAYIGIANIFNKRRQFDSAIFYAKRALFAAQDVSFPKQMLKASTLLTDTYKSINGIDSAFKYQELTVAAKDSLYNSEKVREIQNLSFNEQLRQQEIAEQQAREQKERKDHLQLTAIAIFIVIFLLVLLVLGRRNTRPRVIEFLGVLVLLLLFEFINFLIHPYIGRLTRNTPIFYLLVAVLLAAVLAPIHHYMTTLIIEKLVMHNHLHRIAKH
jgi:tetratricopeptide (TPR) repeat protein